jgi:hypothetical protein
METGSHCVAQVGLKLTILLPQDYRYVPPCPVQWVLFIFAVLGIEPRPQVLYHLNYTPSSPVGFLKKIINHNYCLLRKIGTFRKNQLAIQMQPLLIFLFLFFFFFSFGSGALTQGLHLELLYKPNFFVCVIGSCGLFAQAGFKL